jgi:hypothetical protein
LPQGDCIWTIKLLPLRRLRRRFPKKTGRRRNYRTSNAIALAFAMRLRHPVSHRYTSITNIDGVGIKLFRDSHRGDDNLTATPRKNRCVMEDP